MMCTECTLPTILPKVKISNFQFLAFSKVSKAWHSAYEERAKALRFAAFLSRKKSKTEKTIYFFSFSFIFIILPTSVID